MKCVLFSSLTERNASFSVGFVLLSELISCNGSVFYLQGLGIKEFLKDLKESGTSSTCLGFFFLVCTSPNFDSLPSDGCYAVLQKTHC